MNREQNYFIYVVKPIERLLDKSKWTEKDKIATSAHLDYMEYLNSTGKLVLAGKTLNEDTSSFGMVILKVDTEKQAIEIMENDPPVKAGILEAELLPYEVTSKGF